ncbi:MAG: type II secretion system F family protein [Candidatus Aenigmarchaeota archaeon]|nr:type II secretion system F family protein [Candidatus Aenigmarchaeota archaeon]MCX8190861.1 type II secretion system F family protein [Candidatus Aenigmarchaeota archaeon]MDW8159863.1 type II secretion system F family protein [Candidatus Aenigmarchaeota archaeon]
MEKFLELSTEIKIKIFSILIGCFLVSIGYISNDVGVLGNSILLSVIFIFGVFSIFEYKKYREFKEMEEKFPIFLRDLTEALNSGMSLPKAISTVTKYDYGTLSKEIKWMANQISWHIPINRVLDRFSSRMKKSKKISTAVKILKEAYNSGGNTVAVLTSLSESFETLEQLEKDRRSMLNQYVVMIYAISIIFLVVVIMIQRLLIPILSNPQLTSIALSNPCANCVGISCQICDLYRYVAFSLFGAKEDNFYYISLFFFLSLIQAIFAGIVAGEIAEGSPRAGVKHSIILASIIVGAFLMIYKIGIIGV